MSLGLEWFSEDEKLIREKAYPGYTADDWASALVEHLGDLGPIADEAAQWLAKNMTHVQIHEDFGYEVLQWYVDVSGDKEAELFIEQLPQEEKAELLEARKRAQEMEIVFDPKLGRDVLRARGDQKDSTTSIEKDKPVNRPEKERYALEPTPMGIRTVKTGIWILIVVAVGVWLANSMIDNRRLRDEERAEAQKMADALSASVVAMTNQHQAHSDWAEKLSGGEHYRFLPVLTIELEDLWINNGPILFVGAIKDIASEGDNLYTVTIERGLFSGTDYMFDTELRLKLTSDKAFIDRFLSNHPALFENYGFNNGVAVIATVRTIQTHEYANEDDMSVDVRIGLGEMIDLIYVGDDLF